ncbi:MmgE/PrpD family protein [Pseudonocardia kujensis]|uniref:MmgE/PrpD family protein n=1 Tax=Pseudonocardia kujensis TaxID=1128675 RepID=UPI001E504A71|nr:MmgE/PrpD family protein [Pseudonocardia kujensis]MCE0763226.1 MmgE/PrpD family protein [Pseudonocardia kujensis]
MGTTLGYLADWAARLDPTDADRALARTALADTLAVTLAAADEPIVSHTVGQPTALRWAAIGHALDFDDVHLPSTSHVSVVCASATLATGGGEREFLAAAGVMARLGTALGWGHYRRGWHATCTAGAPAAAVAAALSLGLDPDGVRRAMALAVPAAGGVQQAFGTEAKPLQVGFATDAGVRAARLAAAGAGADPRALDDWFALMGGAQEIDLSGPAVPGGLAVKPFPCCYALQRPIGAVRLLGPVPVDEIDTVEMCVAESVLQPLAHDRPRTGAEGRFSLPYAVAAALVDGFPTAASFTDAAVRRPEVRRLLERIAVRIVPGGEGVLAGDSTVRLTRRDGGNFEQTLHTPPGHPDFPLSPADLHAKIAGCVGDAAEVADATWRAAARLLSDTYP